MLGIAIARLNILTTGSPQVHDLGGGYSTPTSVFSSQPQSTCTRSIDARQGAQGETNLALGIAADAKVVTARVSVRDAGVRARIAAQ